MRWTRWISIWLAAACAGCASNAPSSVLAEGPRMIDLYRGTAAETEAEAAAARGAAMETLCRWWLFAWPCGEPETEPAQAAQALEEPAYARSAANELELLFPRLPNPDVYIYVPPHLATGERVPVPGYTTAVPLYERVEYALPEESEDGGTDPAEGGP